MQQVTREAILSVINKLTESGFKITYDESDQTESGKCNLLQSGWKANKGGVSVRGNHSGFSIYLRNSVGGYEVTRSTTWKMEQGHWRRVDANVDDYLKVALEYQAPKINSKIDWILPCDTECGPIRFYDIAISGNPVVYARVLGVAGMKYPKISVDWVNEPNVDICYVVECRNAMAGRYTVVTDGSKVIRCKLFYSGDRRDYRNRKRDVKLSRGSARAGRVKGIDLKNITTKDIDIIKLAIEAYHEKPWIGLI